MPSPICQVKNGGGSFVATTNGVNVTAGATITVRLADYTGVNTWLLELFGTDETASSPPALTYVPGAQPTYTFTATALGTALGFRSTINQGLDANFEPNSSLICTFGVFVPTAGGARVLFSGQTNESSPIGWIGDFNSVVRNGGGAFSGNATSIQSIPVDSTAPSVDGQVLRYSVALSKYVDARLTSDDIDAGLTVSLGIASGGNGPFEVGATWSPMFTASPACNASGVTAATVTDSDGGGPTSRLGSGNPIAGPSASYTMGVGNKTVTLSLTKGGITRTGSATVSGQTRTFAGVSSGASATGANSASGSSCSLVGATGTLTGGLTNSFVGNTVAFVSGAGITASGQYVYLLFDASFGSSHTFKDNFTGLGFDVQPATTFSFTNAQGAARSYCLVRSTNPLTGTFQPYPAT